MREGKKRRKMRDKKQGRGGKEENTVTHTYTHPDSSLAEAIE